MLLVGFPIAIVVVTVWPSHLTLARSLIVLPVACVHLLVCVLHHTLTVLHAVAELSVVGRSALPSVGAMAVHILADKFTVVNITVGPDDSCFAFSYIVLPDTSQFSAVGVGNDSLAVSLIVLEGTNITKTFFCLEGSVTMSHFAEPLSCVVGTCLLYTSDAADE